jgi:hypothetical protein
VEELPVSLKPHHTNIKAECSACGGVLNIVHNLKGHCIPERLPVNKYRVSMKPGARD